MYGKLGTSLSVVAAIACVWVVFTVGDGAVLVLLKWFDKRMTLLPLLLIPTLQ